MMLYTHTYYTVLYSSVLGEPGILRGLAEQLGITEDALVSIFF